MIKNISDDSAGNPTSSLAFKAAQPLPDISEALVLFMRGFFATPVITSLSRLGAVEVMLCTSSFALEDFSTIPNKKVLRDSLQYLAGIGLVSQVAQTKIYQLTELGRQIFQRASSFYVPHSYHAHMEQLHAQLAGKITTPPTVDRAENVIGSGKTHLRYFPYAISFLKRRVQVDIIADIGCGDGGFLIAVLKAIPNKAAIGIDCSPISTQITYDNLRKECPDHRVDVICSNAFDVDDWGMQLKQTSNGKKLALSMWFLIHEISQNDPDQIMDFLQRVHHFFPSSPLVLCEIVRHDDDILAKYCKKSFMSEYLFFHDLSGQGVLSWQQYQEILREIPYELRSERLFDEVSDSDGNSVPSSFLWGLVPKKS